MSAGKGASEPDPIIVGYEYYLAWHLVFCLGGIVGVNAIRLAKKTIIWSGELFTNGDIYISKPSLYGGNKDAGQGGFIAYVSALFGAATQSKPSYLPLSGGNPSYCPAYRDRFSMVFHNGAGGGAYVGNSGSIDDVSALLTGADTDIAWQSSLRYIQAADNQYRDLNPAHIIRDLLIGDDIGQESNEADLDDDYFVAVAQALYDEGFGLSCHFSGGEPVENYITEVCRHINGLVYQDIYDGKYKIKLLRDDYDPDEAIGGAEFPILFNEDNCKLKSFQRIGTGEQVNRVEVEYYSVSKDDNETVVAYDLALLDEQGGAPVTKRVSYDGVTSKALAEKLANRDLKEQSTPLARVQLECSRVASYLRNGMVFKWSNDELEITEMILRVMKISYGTVANGSIIIDAVEDVFGYGTTVYSGDNHDGWVDESGDPELLTNRLVFEIPYYFYIKKSGAIPEELGTDGGIVMTVAKKQTVTDKSYYVHETLGTDWQASRRVAGFSPSGELLSAVGLMAGEIIVDLDDPEFVEVGFALVIRNAGVDEIMEITGIAAANSPYDSGHVLTVKRGCADTLPATHSAGTMVYVYERGYGLASDGFGDGDLVKIRMYPTNSQGTYSTADSPQPAIDTVTMDSRAFRPYPPANVTINGEYYPADAVDQSPDVIEVAWYHRNRETQGAELYGWTQNIATLPANHEYVLQFRDPSDNDLWREVVTTTPFYSWSEADQIADTGGRPASIRVVIYTRHTVTMLTSASYTHDFSH